MTTDDFVLYDAAYRRDFEHHLKSCSACASSVGELAGLPGLMSRVSLDQLSAVAEPVPDTLLPLLARTVRRERGRRRWVFGAAAAVAACLITVGAVAITRPDSPAQTPATASASTPSGTANLAFTALVPSLPVTASARLVDLDWGTRIDLTCAYRSKKASPASGIPYTMFVIDRQGAAEEVVTWKALPNRELTVIGKSSRARRDIAAVEIRTLKGRTILRLST